MKIFPGILLLVVIIIVSIYLFFLFASIVISPSTQQGSLNYVCFNPSAGRNCFSVELAKTSAERETGLMFRTQLDKDKGMFFIFDKEGIYPFWMKNTLIPLDIIWVDSQRKVVYISQNVQPCKSLICPSVVPTVPVKYVLEINAGLVQEMSLEVGDKLQISIAI